MKERKGHPIISMAIIINIVTAVFVTVGIHIARVGFSGNIERPVLAFVSGIVIILLAIAITIASDIVLTSVLVELEDKQW